ncbi:type II secretion system protein GspL [Rheinheimera sp. MMS21-TC3]|uniref:type II secretion system protein GspL n=1 Tax=Rheinheimera sp. MMS21-TC3 TaxID=3072790 RepID=UPI0028C39798|nr:type II secretion system protein GspL [Rheinheimera sp. MMS21-TC3]WNO59835.1 type II secretion system protein GspL [Rheinheimera sp. MMS21-TC3]
MSEQLIIRLGSRAEQPLTWLVWASHNNEVIASGELANVEQLADLATRVGQRQVVALVPASDVVLKQVALPTKPNRQVLQALPYMLEEEQAEDIEQLFIALGDVLVNDGQYSQQVAICQRHRLEQWLDWLQQAGFKVIRLLPDALLLPEQELPACIQLQEQWLVKQEPWQIAAVEQSWWQDYLQLAQLPKLTSYSPWPAENSYPHQLAQPELPLALLAAQLANTQFNLLQAEYKPKRQANTQFSVWRNSAILAVACIGLYLVQLGVTNLQLARQHQQLQQQSISVYKQAFPNESVVNLSLQLQRKLGQVDAGTDFNFLTLLDALQQQLATVPDVSLENLRFDSKLSELRFQAKAGSFQSFEQLKNKLEQAGFSVNQGTLSNDGDKVQGSVAMRGKA